jgi:Rod binding domain-containing protein
MSIDRIPPPDADANLTSEQRSALKKLHDATQQFESVFVNMLFKTMREGQSKTSITGKIGEAERTFGEMLDEKRAEDLAKTGSLGIGKLMEAQLRQSVICSLPSGPAPVEPSTIVPPSTDVKRTPREPEVGP